MLNLRFAAIGLTLLIIANFSFSQDRRQLDNPKHQFPIKITQDLYDPASSPKEDLCTPVYNSGCGMGDGFEDFAIAEIENYNSLCDDLNGTGWSQYLELGPAILFPGITYEVEMSTGYSNQYVTIWIDFNDDFELTEDEIILFDFVMEDVGVMYTVEVTIPMTPYLGMHYMRARTNWQSSCDDPCASYGYGEAEDYYVIIGDAASGDVEGSVVEYSGGAPISGAIINLEGIFDYTTETEPDGGFAFDFVFTGEYTISCEKEGYNFEEYVIMVEEDLVTEIDFQLTQPTIELNTESINVSLPVNGEYEEIAWVENNGDGELLWSASIAFQSKETKEYLDLQFEYPAENGYGEAGIETDGNYLYTTMWNENNINKYDLDGTFIESFTITGVFGLRDLAYDGTYFYGCSGSPTVYEMDFENEVLVSTFEAPIMVRGIAYNPDEDYFYANNWNTPITMFDKTGNVLGEFETGPIGENYYGFAYDNVSFGGPYLWGYAQTGDSQNELVQIQLPSGVETGFSLDIATVISGPTFQAAGGLFTHPNLIYGKWTIGGLVQGETIWGLELSEANTWIGLAPYTGTVQPGESEPINIMLNAIDQDPGQYNAEIHFTSWPEVGNPVIEVELTITEGVEAPENLVYTVDCEIAELCWEYAGTNQPDSFAIYINDDVTYAEENCYEIYGPDFYNCYVTAWLDGIESIPSNETSFEIPFPDDMEPNSLMVDSLVYENVYLSWQMPIGCAEVSGYNIYRNNEKINDTPLIELKYSDVLMEAGTFEYYTTAVYGYGESDPSNTEMVVFTSLNENQEKEFVIFPNPVKGKLNIRTKNSPCNFSLMNNQGIVVVSQKITDNDNQIDLSEFKPGLYFLKLENSDGVFSHKLIVE